jgi:uncharacterized membrane protein
MNVSEEQEIKKEFLLERVILFSDAVFAIIITIMVIEIHLPEGFRHADPEHITEGFKELIPKIIGYIFSFAFIAMFWMRHLKMFSFLKDFNRGLLVLNLLFLFFLSLFPATVSFISGAVSPSAYQYKWGFNMYMGVVLSCTLIQALLINYLVKNKALLCINNPDMEETLKWEVQRRMIYIIPAMMVIILGLNYLDTDFRFTVIPIAFMGFMMNILGRKYYPNAKTPLSYLTSVFGRNRKSSQTLPTED